MEILKSSNTTNLSATFQVSASGTYFLEYEDLLTRQVFSASATASYGAVTFQLDPKYLSYNGNFSATVKNSSDEQVAVTNIDVVRPYCDLDKMALSLNITDGSEVEYERVARYMIESLVHPFNFVRKEKVVVGKGFDYLPIDENIHKIYKVYENEELMYDINSSDNKAEYRISRDGTSIIEYKADPPEDKMNYKKVWRDRYLDVDFAEGYEYIIDADFGWKVIPQDIQEATELLMQDLSSGALKYANRGIESFDNEDFKIKFARTSLNGTGNIIVDRILEKYKNRIRVEVL